MSVFLKKVELVNKRIKNKCSCCKDNVTPCYNCKTLFGFVDRMAIAEIPVDYWERSMKNFYGCDRLAKFINDNINNIDDMYLNGVTIFFAGERGRGKTMAACSILKKALLSSYKAHYTTLSDMISRTMTDNYFKLRIKDVDFLVIDEIDNRFFPTTNSMELYGGQLESIIRSRMQNKLPTIMCSNAVDIDQIFSGQFKTSFQSLWSQFVKTIVVGGGDARKSKEKLDG